MLNIHMIHENLNLNLAQGAKKSSNWAYILKSVLLSAFEHKSVCVFSLAVYFAMDSAVFSAYFLVHSGRQLRRLRAGSNINWAFFRVHSASAVYLKSRSHNHLFPRRTTHVGIKIDHGGNAYTRYVRQSSCSSRKSNRYKIWAVNKLLHRFIWT